MKYIVLVLCIAVALCSAEPPAYRQARFGNSGKQVISPNLEVEPLSSDAEEIEGRAAPYPPSGWKPQGARFELPRAGDATPAAEYLPADQYGPPSGQAVVTTTDILLDDDISTTTYTPLDDDSTTLPPAAEGSGAEEKANLIEDVETIEVENEKPVQKINDQGSYFVLLPDARIQRILYSVQQDPERLQFSTRLQSVGNQALTGPLLFYTPQYVQVV